MRIVATFLALAVTLTTAAGSATAETRAFSVVNVEYQGTKVWVPGTLIVRKGDHVKIKLINNIPQGGPQHGYTIPAFHVQTVVTRGKPEVVEFTADRVGIFPIKCHLHPAHIGGQLLVIE